MARNGMDLHAAWLACSKLPGGATSWGNCLRRWKEAEAAAQQHQPPEQPPSQTKKTPHANGKGKAPAVGASASSSQARTGPIVPPRVQRTLHQVAKALDLSAAYRTEYKSIHKEATRAFADAASAGLLRKAGTRPADIAASHDMKLYACTLH